MTKPLRTAIIGCGLYGRAHAARLVALPAEVQLVAFYDHKAENAAAYSREFGGAVYTDTERMFAEIRPNLLVEIGERRLFDEAAWQLARPLDQGCCASCATVCGRALDR